MIIDSNLEETINKLKSYGWSLLYPLTENTRREYWVNDKKCVDINIVYDEFCYQPELEMERSMGNKPRLYLSSIELDTFSTRLKYLKGKYF